MSLLRSTDIVHTGLQSVYLSGTASTPPPARADWGPAQRRMLALNVATSLSHAALPGYGLRAGSRKGHEFGPLASGGVIEFDWVGSYARNVDWR